MYRLVRNGVLAVTLLAFLGGCTPSKPATPETAEDFGSEADFKLDSALANYKLPTSSIAPTPNANPAIDRAMVRMGQVAIRQALIFDGRRASEGIIIVGRQGRRKPMLVAVAVYMKRNLVAMRDATSFSGADVPDGQVMRDRFINAI